MVDARGNERRGKIVGWMVDARGNERREKVVGWMAGAGREREHLGETEKPKDAAGRGNESREKTVG